ncbi:tyrosine-type recombinase/integrase [Psychrobacter sp. I-STPA10]|uniref:tyrosine-type recombinase/integrase n=1 Tax=Psychrobacter sp. I-STPA10 TaxID=2585769 RepID=UPI001E6572AF|nr:tyrosine-type recombinase/integrase [Psychrobacter sp. I-STPA10]
MKIKLTKKFVDTVPYANNGTDIYMDEDLSGFALYVGKQTKKYRLHKRINGELRRDEVEETHLITLTEAREKAKLMMVNIKKGLDAYDGINAEPKIQESNINVPTLREAYKYVKESKKRLSKRTIETYDNQILSKLEDWLDLPLNDINKSMVSDMHKKISKTSKAQANATMRAFRSVWNYCRVSFLDENEEYVLKEHPVSILNAKKDWHNIKPRTRHVEEEYIQPYFKTLIDHVNGSSHKFAPHSNNARDILIIFLFTGVRLNEAQPLRWTNVDLKAGRVVFKATKNGSDYHMPVGKILHAILRERKKLSMGDEWVFPSNLATSNDHIKDLSKSYHHISKKAGLHITPHDLRRTFGTVANSLNVNYPVLKRLLNHREAKITDDVTLQYIQVSQRQLRDALNEIEKFYCKHVNMTQDEVIQKLYPY